MGDLREIARERQVRRVALERALEAIPHPSLFESLRPVVEQLPLVVRADIATIRLADENGKLHLVGATGCPASDVRSHALERLDISLLKQMADSDLLQEHVASLGIRWLKLEWFELGEVAFGALLIGARAERRPQRSQLTLFSALKDRLVYKLGTAKRTSSELRRCALELARSAEPQILAPAIDQKVAKLRPRERFVLELCADGLSIIEIATLLFISPHTVRTHVKSALRRLGVHSRSEAARLVCANQILQLP